MEDTLFGKAFCVVAVTGIQMMREEATIDRENFAVKISRFHLIHKILAVDGYNVDEHLESFLYLVYYQVSAAIGRGQPRKLNKRKKTYMVMINE